MGARLELTCRGSELRCTVEWRDSEHFLALSSVR